MQTVDKFRWKLVATQYRFLLGDCDNSKKVHSATSIVCYDPIA